MDNDQAKAADLLICKNTSRRSFIKKGAAAVVAQAASALTTLASDEAPKAAAPRIAASRRGHGSGHIPKAPNILVIMTDQERHHMHSPAGWAEKNLPALQRLKRNGLNFTRA